MRGELGGGGGGGGGPAHLSEIGGGLYAPPGRPACAATTQRAARHADGARHDDACVLVKNKATWDARHWKGGWGWKGEKLCECMCVL